MAELNWGSKKIDIAGEFLSEMFLKAGRNSRKTSAVEES